MDNKTFYLLILKKKKTVLGFTIFLMTFIILNYFEVGSSSHKRRKLLYTVQESGALRINWKLSRHYILGSRNQLSKQYWYSRNSQDVNIYPVKLKILNVRTQFKKSYSFVMKAHFEYILDK